MLNYFLGILILNAIRFGKKQVEMADDFRGEGKIYVVIAIIIVILAGFFFLMFKLDRRAKRLEKEIEEQ